MSKSAFGSSKKKHQQAEETDFAKRFATPDKIFAKNISTHPFISLFCLNIYLII